MDGRRGRERSRKFVQGGYEEFVGVGGGEIVWRCVGLRWGEDEGFGGGCGKGVESYEDGEDVCDCVSMIGEV